MFVQFKSLRRLASLKERSQHVPRPSNTLHPKFKLHLTMSLIFIYFENIGAYVLFTVRGFDVLLENCQYMIICLNGQNENGLSSGIFIGYATGRILNSSRFVEGTTSQFVHAPINGIYRVSSNEELTLVGYISQENLMSLYRCYCSVCGLLLRFPSNLTTHSRVHNGDRPYSCSRCNEYFQTTSNRNRHERNCRRLSRNSDPPIHYRPFECQDESGLFFGTFVGYASGRSLNSSGFVESSALQFVYPYTSGIYRVDDNNELILVGYISHENLRSLYRHRCPECERLFRYPSILNNHLNVHTGR
ncbi:2601_t:CDS:2 [Acaulospora morrowiae]|uniref:2601_t:CDS:1 n=1 Tax=Acaulospora morrowiae TaxID=94023 RepID=A0A9N8YYN1_9GLOM|nr:2601_t:CDS:2 [Acaulospora morrowiae]